MSAAETGEQVYLQRLSELRAGFAQRARREAAEVTALTSALANPDARERLRDLAHRARGTSGTLGFAAIADAAGTLEEAIDVGAADSEVERLAAALAGQMSGVPDA